MSRHFLEKEHSETVPRQKHVSKKPCLKFLKNIQAGVLISVMSLLGSGCHNKPVHESPNTEVKQGNPQKISKQAAQQERMTGEESESEEQEEWSLRGGHELSLINPSFYQTDASYSAVINRLTGEESSVKDIPSFPITLRYQLQIDQDQLYNPLTNYSFINSTRISIDNLFALGLYGVGQHKDLHKSKAYRGLALGLQTAEMLFVSRLGHEFAHGYDDIVDDKKALPYKRFLFAELEHNGDISTKKLILSQAAGMNNSELMALQYYKQPKNIVAALGFLISRNDALLQWSYGHIYHDGKPEKRIRKKLEKHSHNAPITELKSPEKLEEEFIEEERQPEDKTDPAIYQVTGHGDIVAYIKLLEILGHGNAHKDKELAIILGSNFFTAYFWQSFYELSEYLASGKQTHEPWRMIGPVEWPVFSTFRLSEGYLVQARLPVVVQTNLLNRLTVIGGSDLDKVLGDFNTLQIGSEISGSIHHSSLEFRWQIGTLFSFDRDSLQFQGNAVEAGISFGLEQFKLHLSAKYQHADPVSEQVLLQGSGVILEFGTEIILGKDIKKPSPALIHLTPSIGSPFAGITMVD